MIVMCKEMYGREMSKVLQLRVALQDLIRQELPYLHIQSFYETGQVLSAIENIVSDLANSSSKSSIYASKQVPLFEATENSDARIELLRNGLLPEQYIDDVFFPYVSPLAYWWRMMDVAWPPGVTRLNIGGHRLPFGILRLWQKGSKALPHQDVLRRELRDDPVASSFARQFGMNVYLSTGEGGELCLWNKKVNDDEWRGLGLKGSYGYNLAQLGEPAHTLSPATGDLILIDTERVHAVSPVLSGARLTLSGFVGCVSDNESLVCWS